MKSMLRNNKVSENSFPTKNENKDEPDNFRKIFLGGLSPVLTEDTLQSFYRQFGEIIDVKIMRDPSTSRPRGFGFITFVDSSCVDRAQAARPHVVDGKPVDSKRVLARGDAPKSTPSSSGRKIFVGGLKDVHDEQALREHFNEFGNVYNVKVIIDKNTGRKRGFAYVEFEDYDSADKAVLHRNHTIKYLSVDVKKSNYKEEQAKRMANQTQNGNGNAPPAAGPPPPTGAYPPAPYPPAPYPPPYGYPPYGGWGAPPAPYPAQPPAYGAQPPAWNGWGYSAPPAGGSQPANPPPATNNGNYQQSYNGGPQKGGRLQNYRNSPYRS